MTPGARVQAAIDVLDAVAAEGRPADLVFNAYTRARRYIGAKDRATIAALVYGVLRHRAQLDWWIARQREGARRGLYAVDSRKRVIAHLAILDGWTPAQIAGACDGDRFRPKPLDEQERGIATALAGRSIDHPSQPHWVRCNFPEWLAPALSARFGDRLAEEMAALSAPAPLDLRVNMLKGTREEARQVLHRDGLEATPTALSPWGLRIEGRPSLPQHDAYTGGLVEVQDEGSQLSALLVAAQPGMRVCDFCAGAGGKTLALAAMMGNKGHIVACDTSSRRLEGATTRLRRAGAFNVERRAMSGERDPWVKRHAQSFDRVLVDAPCTGSGTWRRNPDAKWSLRPTDIDELTALQRRILDSAARLVKPGGRLVYATCSLLAVENEEQAAAFVAAHPEFKVKPIDAAWAEVHAGPCPDPGPYLHLSPARHGTDGFFIAVFEYSPLNTGATAEL
ncbi:MAG: RsmB/NOP family class I SAM-dependent RNA methyltransferase [Proteobacteria bacterium]|nr:RsmB/NOP family class I SAM-dependent RNA methyltransferase [Pseudomonadota bacterium]